MALRFPGELCAPGSLECDAPRFEALRRAWHIDGLPSDALPGVTDHFGSLRPFDALVGVLLADVPEAMSG
ncbi:MAG: hypothetical protein WCO82_11610, partial [Sphingomonadales bacterium]